MLLVACVSLLLSAGVPAAKPAPVAKPTSSTPTPTLKPVGDGQVFAVGDVVRTSVDNANVRGDPSTDKRPVATLPFGTQVRVVEAAATLTTIGKLTQRWYRVETIDQPKPATGWLFGSTLTTLGSTTWSVTFSAEGNATVRFFRPGEVPALVGLDVDARGPELQAVAGPPLAGRASLLLRSCDAGDCADLLIGQSADNIAVIGSGQATRAPLSAKDVVVDRDSAQFRGEAVSLAVLSQPKAKYTDAELVERFLKNCNDVVKVTALNWSDRDIVLPQCEVRSFEQNCALDDCVGEEEGCLSDCGKRCNGCDATCGSTCSTCMNRCTDDVCRRQCAKARVACFKGCVGGANTCRSNGCADVYKTCSTTRATRINAECGGPQACRIAAHCNAVDGSCPKQSAWCTSACFEQELRQWNDEAVGGSP
jgi:hypothetical protein